MAAPLYRCLNPMKITHSFKVPVSYIIKVNGMKVSERTVEEVVEVTVDFEELAFRMGERACKNKSGKCIEAKGLVVIRQLKQASSITEPF